MNKIYHEDCRQTIARLDNESIDMVFADPFYVPENKFNWELFTDFYWNFNREWLTALKPKVKKTGHIFISFSSEDMARFEYLLKER
jgi:DNA modification methylase